MDQKSLFRMIALICFVTLATSVSFSGTTMKIDPAGTWEYSAPSAPEGYTMGQMVIAEKEDGYSVTIVFNEYSRIEAERVEFSKKNLKFVVYVEYEEVSVSGDFDTDRFTGTVNYSEGSFDFSAVKKVEE